MNTDTSLKKILILAANPKGTSPSRLDAELRDISEGLRRSQNRNQFVLEHRLAVRPRDIQRAMLDVNPQIVHFSGQGSGEEGLVFEDETGNMQLVDGLALAGLFELFADQIECVVLNRCYSLVQADAIARYISYVVGMSQAIGNKAAIEFAVGFYDALGAGRSIDFAYKLGCSSIRLSGLSEQLIPVLRKKNDHPQSLPIQNVARTEWMLVLSGTFDDTVKEKVEALIEHLQQLTGDTSLTLKKIKAGSIILIIEGSQESFKLIETLFNSGEIIELLGMPIESIRQIINSPNLAEIPTNEGRNISARQSRYSELNGTETASVGTIIIQQYEAIDPASPLQIKDPRQRSYYIDFSSIRFGATVEELKQNITDGTSESTCQILTGYVGCGKSTELLRLKGQLEEEGFYTIYIDASDVLDFGDIDGRDLLLAIARQIGTDLRRLNIPLRSESFTNLFAKLERSLTEIETTNQLENSEELNRIVSLLKLDSLARQRYRQHLELQEIIDAINSDLLKPGVIGTGQYRMRGLVVIVDNLDRMGSFSGSSNRNSDEHLFIDQGEFLRKLNCHLIYTMPLSLKFSDEYDKIIQHFGEPKLLPLVPLQHSDGHRVEVSLALLKQVVMARAYPNLMRNDQLERIYEIFDPPENLDILCQLSGGHLRTLLALVHRCLIHALDFPITRSVVEEVVEQQRREFTQVISESEWDLLRQIPQQGQANVEEKQYRSLLINRFVLEYQDDQGSLWYVINPILENLV